jgi:selenocysteine lyase/cysteine desulfurase
VHAEQLLIDVEGLRRSEFPITDRWLYFDNATYGPHPRRYVQAISDVASRLSADLLGTTSSEIEGVRRSAARLLHAPVEQVALLRSTGEGINLVASGVAWQAGDEVILYELDFPSLIAPWLAQAARGVQVRVVQDRGRNRFEVHDFRELLTPRTRAISVSLVNNTTGFRAPVEDIAALCREHGLWFSVDAVQAVGSVDVDAPSIGADVIVAHSYKFLLSGFGQAIAYLSERAIGELGVPHVGLRNLQLSPEASLLQSGLQLHTSARKFEPSNPNLAAMLAMGASIDLLLEIEPQRIEQHNRELCRRLRDGLLEKGYRVITSDVPGESAGLVCAVADSVAPAFVQQQLAAEHIQCAVRGGNLRFAPHLFNTVDEVQRLAEVLPAN